ncbi:MAG: lipoprotein [Gammaproteobacteria bacterium]
MKKFKNLVNIFFILIVLSACGVKGPINLFNILGSL